MIRVLRQIAAATIALLLLTLSPSFSSAQDLFELEVFESGSTPAGQYEVEFHTNAVSRGRAAAPLAPSHRPIHMSVEVTRGWTNRWEAALFVQTAPFGPSGSARFAGGHVRSKFRIGELGTLPLRAAISAEYTFNRGAFDDELQTFEVRPILDYERGRLTLVANPSLEMVIRGPEEGLAPVFDLSAKAAWRLAPSIAGKVEYFSAAAATRHLRPEPGAHHLVFSGIDLEVGPGWELSIGAGRCVTGGEPWLMKSVIGYRF